MGLMKTPMSEWKAAGKCSCQLIAVFYFFASSSFLPNLISCLLQCFLGPVLSTSRRFFFYLYTLSGPLTQPYSRCFHQRYLLVGYNTITNTAETLFMASSGWGQKLERWHLFIGLLAPTFHYCNIFPQVPTYCYKKTYTLFSDWPSFNIS